MIYPYEALEKIFNKVEPEGEELISVFDSLHRVVSREIASNRSLPPYDNAAMDGYAVRFEDIKKIPAKLKLAGNIKAGDSVDGLELKKGECYRIMTGAFIPKGADTVVEFEVTRQKDEEVEILKEKKQFANVRFRGEDIKAGSTIDFVGKPITPYKLSRLVSTNNIFVYAYKQPSVCIISTGDELSHPGSCNEFDTIDSNSFFLKSLLKNSLNIDAAYLGISKDNKEDLINVMKSALNYDVILTSAGISFGDFDVVTNAEKDLGINWEFKYVKQKPGKPCAFGQVSRSLIFSFPGNPVSTAFCSFFYLVPALKKMMGYKKYRHIPIEAVLTSPMYKRNDRVHFNRVKVEFKEDNFYAQPFETQGSNIIESISKCNGFAMVERKKIGEIPKGEKLKVFLYDFESVFDE